MEEYEEFFDGNQTEQEKSEIYQYEVELPLSIEMMIKKKELKYLGDELLIYSLKADYVLDNTFFQSSPLNQLMKFLSMAVDSGNLNIVKIVWEHGIQTYLHANLWNTRILLDYIVELIRENRKNKLLKYIFTHLAIDNVKIYLNPNENHNDYSTLRRNNICGNFLAAAIYYNNLEAIKMLLPKQLKYQDRFYDYLDNDFLNLPKVEQNNFVFGTGNSLGFFSIHSSDALYSLNPTIYAFDNGNIEALEQLLENGYHIDFNKLDFAMNVSSYAHKDTLKYLIKNYPGEMLQVNTDEVLRASNYPLLKWMIDHGLDLQRINVNQLFNYNFEFTFNDNQNLLNQKLKNIEKCMIYLSKKGFKTSDILIPLKFGISINSQPFVDLCFSIYKKTDSLDITSIFHRVCKNVEMLTYISEKVKLICDADNLTEPPPLMIREFQRCLKLIEFIFKDGGSVNMLVTQILDLNAVTGIKLLLKHKFITDKNYSTVVDYIINSELDKLIPILISSSANIGGVKRIYDI